MVIVLMLGKPITGIMLVDDEADITTSFKRGLEPYGFEVDAFMDPEEALAYQSGKHDLLISDVKMPKVTGFEMYRPESKVDDKTTKFTANLHLSCLNQDFLNYTERSILDDPSRAISGRFK